MDMEKIVNNLIDSCIQLIDEFFSAICRHSYRELKKPIAN
jgi:hypothetical protein